MIRYRDGKVDRASMMLGAYVGGTATVREFADALDEALARERALREELRECSDALSDWMHTYGADVSSREEQDRAYARIHKGGGTLAYIARLQKKIAGCPCAIPGGG